MMRKIVAVVVVLLLLGVGVFWWWLESLPLSTERSTSEVAASYRFSRENALKVSEEVQGDVLALSPSAVEVDGGGVEEVKCSSGSTPEGTGKVSWVSEGSFDVSGFPLGDLKTRLVGNNWVVVEEADGYVRFSRATYQLKVNVSSEGVSFGLFSSCLEKPVS